jgi:hypothetical protein
MHFRYYSAGLGRFMRPDNVSGNMTNPQSWNLYSYVVGNPVNFNDPTGHGPMPDWRSVFSSDNATGASWDGGLMFSFGLGRGEGLGTVGGDSAGRLNDLFKSIEKPAQGGGQSGGSRSLFGNYSFVTNPRYMQPPPVAAPSSSPQFRADAELAKTLLYVEVNLASRYYWTNFVSKGHGCYDYAYTLAGDIKALGLVYWHPQIWERYFPPHFSVVLQPTIQSERSIWIDAYTDFQFHVFNPSWNYALDNPNP